jgi:5'-methylthioinosine phosphorylase
MAQPAKACAVPLAIIGGSGLYRLDVSASSESFSIHTPYSAAPVELALERTAAGAVWFLPRHGRNHSIAPHLINYRANVWALREAGVDTVIAVNAVGGISEQMTAGALVLPDQLIDYSWGREHTFFASEHALDKHVDFTWPYDRELALVLQQRASMLDIPVLQGGVYACTQGPRLETAAEIRRLKQDGCDIVGMTGMPEAGLARELGLRYACLALVVNKAAGLGPDTITHEEISRNLLEGIGKVRAILLAALPQLAGQKSP